MEHEEKPTVESLEGRLNSLDIEDDASEQRLQKTEGSTTGWKSKESLEDLKEKFRDLTHRAKQEAHDGDLEQSLKLYKKAYKIHESEKVAKRIEKLEGMLEELGDENSADDEDDGVVKVSKGFKMSEKIYNKLYQYQKEGVLWFWKLYEGRKGGILGDDMGLGKTIQVIAFLAGMFGSCHIKTVLIIMPVSLLANWEKEFKKWAPEIRVRHFHGSSVKQRSDNLAKIQSRNGVCLTTYGLAHTSTAKFSQDRYGETFTWDYIILDEGHKIKNTANKTTIAIRAIPAKNHFILSGTPIQNNLREMWALFDFVCQGRLLGTSRSFKQEYENPIVRARERDATAYEKRMGQEMSVHLRELIAPHFLRRTKDILKQSKKTGASDDVGHDDVDGSSDKENEESNGTKKPKLTRKNDFIIWLFLSQTQLQIYEDFVKLDRVKEILMTKKSPLAELNVLKKICDHPRLLSTMACKQLGLSDELDEEEEDTDTNYQWCAPPVEQLVQESGKLVFLMQLLKQLKSEGHRTLVFSQSRKMLDIIEKVLKDKEIKVIRIDGTITNIAERESRIDTFQTDPSYFVFLLTTQVGGVGLTLTAADRVVIFDPSWNPATDAQAVDRAYRIGQKNTVVIYRLITCGSLEEKIYRKQVFKQAITKQTTGSSNNPFRYFASHELRELFVLDDHRSSKTQIQLEKMHSANRVTDTLLDEHVAFLYSTDIFGISDHDLMFTKEAVATEEEISAASEMSAVIQARVRRAAGIMRAESSQATGHGNIPPAPKEKKKKGQTKIQDHAVEVFIPSKEDSSRFKPARKVSKSPPPSDIVDLTVLDARVDDDALEQQFSAIALNDKGATSPVDVRQSEAVIEDNVVEITPEVYFQKEQENEVDRVLINDSAEPLVNHERSPSPDIVEEKTQAENIVIVQEEMIEGISGNVKQSDSETDEEILRKRSGRSPGKTIDSDGSSEDEQNSQLSRNGKSSRHDLESDSDNEPEVNKDSELPMEEIQESTSISEKDRNMEGENHLGNLERGSFHEIPRKSPGRKIIDSDESSEDEQRSELSEKDEESKSSKHVLESDSEDETEVNEESVEIQELTSISEKDKLMEGENQFGDLERGSSPDLVLVEEQRSSSPEIVEEETQAVQEEMMEIAEVAGNIEHSDSEDDDEIPRKRPGHKIIDSDESSEDERRSELSEKDEESKSSEHVLESDSEDETEVNEESVEIQENTSVSKNNEKMENQLENRSLPEVFEINSDSENEVDDISKNGGSSAGEESDSGSEIEAISMNPKVGSNNVVPESDSENEVFTTPKSSTSSYRVPEVHSDYENEKTSDKILENDSGTHDSSPENETSDEKMSQNDSENDESARESHDDDENSENSKQSPSQSDTTDSSSENEQVESPDNPEESEDLKPSYTTCCPRGTHVSESFNIKRCPCVISETEKEAYKMHVNTARRYEKSGEGRLALKHFVAAYKLCDNDVRLRAKIQNCYKVVKKSTSA